MKLLENRTGRQGKRAMDGDGSSLLGLPIVGACLLDDVGLTSSHGGRNRGGRQRAVDSLLPDPDHQTNNIATIESGGMDFEFVSSDLVPVPEFSIDNSSVFGISETGMSESERDCDDLLKDTQCFTSSGVCRPGDQLTSGGVAVLPSSAVMEMYRSVGLRLQIIPLNNLQYISTIQTSTGMHILAVPSGTSVSDLGRLVESPNVSILDSCELETTQECNSNSSKSDETTTSSLEFENEETELSKYECELCQMKFISHGNLTRHLLTHSKSLMLQGRYSCKICGRGFLQRCDLTRHQLTHTHQFPYTCELCRKGFVRRSDLLVHRQYHEGKKNHLCSHCSKSYFKKGDLLRHVRHSHSDSCSLTCDTCGQPYNSRKSLQLHVRLKHA
ncbi:ZFP1-like protein [Mya arenaria]|uniref:ZFP1-like protein n=1 Tax=Mya arenaria TaxID=6604 RepID=A0ABY7FH40_MYAAR|nr:ZFP1-like protein [Mya arenaria]